MQNEIQVLVPMDPQTFRSGLATDKSGTECINPLPYFLPIIQNFERLAVGRYFWFILDFPEWRHCVAGGDVEGLTPFTKTEFATLDPMKLNAATHPEDLDKVLSLSRQWLNFYAQYELEEVKELKMSLFFRMMNAIGNYYWIMVQYPDVILDKKGKIVYGLALATDISHIKTHGEPMMNILNQKKDICLQFFCLNTNTLSKTELPFPRLTRREKEILQLLAKGHGSKQIASMLFISPKTVDNHRQNMLHKTGSKSSSELVVMGVRIGLI